MKAIKQEFHRIKYILSAFILSSFIIFPASVLLEIYDLLNYFPNSIISEIVMPKLDDFIASYSADELKESNEKLHKALYLPYLFIITWYILYIIIIIVQKRKITVRLDTTHMVRASIMIAVLILTSVLFCYQDLRFSRSYGDAAVDYSQSMTVSEYASWQVRFRLFASSLWAAMTFFTLTTLFSITVKGRK